MQLLQEMLL